MKTAIITGASSGIGLEISKAILNKGFKVFGFGRSFKDVQINSDNFIPIELDLTQINTLCQKITELKKENNIHILVNCAGIGYFAPHEELNPQKIHEMVTVNLEVPLILTQQLLRDLKKNRGYIINISSVTAKNINTYGCAYGATKAALSSFSKSLFAEARKYEVKVCSIHPDITKTNFYRNASFEESDDILSYIEPSDVANAVMYILSQNNNIAVTDITIYPQKHKIKPKAH